MFGVSPDTFAKEEKKRKRRRRSGRKEIERKKERKNKRKGTRETGGRRRCARIGPRTSLPVEV